MSRMHRLLLIWLVALALPLQGVAAALRLGCLPDRVQEHSQHVHAAAPQSAGHTGHDMAAGHAHASDSGAATGHSDMADMVKGAMPDLTQHHSTPHSCSACAACCLGAVLLAPQLSPPVVTPLALSLVFRTLQVGPVHFVTGGPDRPPRSSQA